MAVPVKGVKAPKVNKAPKINNATFNQGKNVGTEAANANKKSLYDNLKDSSDSLRSDRKYYEGMDAPEGAEVGQHLSAGKEVGKDGKVQNTSTREGIEAGVNVLTAIASIYSGGAAASAKAAVTTAGKQAAQNAAKTALKDQIKKQTMKNAGKNAAQNAAKQGAKGAGAGKKEMLKNFGSSAAGGGSGKKSPTSMIMDIEPVKDVSNTVFGTIDTVANKAADVIDKVPGAKKLSDKNRDTFVAINRLSDAFSDALNNDMAGAGKNFLKSVGSLLKGQFKTLILPLLVLLGIIIVVVLILVFILLLPVLIPTALFGDIIAHLNSFIIDSAFKAIAGAFSNQTEATKAIVNDVPGYESLSDGRKAVIVTGATAVGTKYSVDGEPKRAGEKGLSNGINDEGLIRWMFWSITGDDPGELEAGIFITDDRFAQISKEELLPGDFGLCGSKVGIYMGNDNWIFIDINAGVIRQKTSMFTMFYRYKEIDNLQPATSSEDFEGGSADVAYYDGPMPSGEFRSRLIQWGGILHNLDIPYSNAWGYNISKSLDVNNAGFRSLVPPGTKRGNGTKFTEPINYDGVNKYNLKGLDCGGYVSYVYFLTTNGKMTANLDAYISGGTPPGFARIPKEQASQGDVVIMPRSHVMMLDHFEADGRLYVYEMSGCSSHVYTINGRQVRYSGSTSVGSGCNGGYCKTHDCWYFTYVGEE